MPSIRDLRKRIQSVKNTQQTTKAMKMVSAAKLRRAQDAIQSNRPYAKQIQKMISILASASDAPVGTEFLSRETPEGTKKKALLFVITSDRGLCGGFNATITKAAQRWIAENKDRCASIDLAFVGRRGRDFFRHRGMNAVFFEEFGRGVNFALAKKVCDWTVEKYLDGTYDEVRFVFNEFKNAIMQVVQTEDFLPVGNLPAQGQTETPDFLIKPTPSEFFSLLLKKHFSTQVYRILLESQASEHGARMSAMENATRNAGAMIRKLTLLYNKQRQAGITKELLEIISGSESQKNSA